MSSSTSVPQLKPSFYAPVPDRDRADDLFKSYMTFLTARNGDLNTFDKREEAMDDMATWDGEFSGRLDPQQFNRNYAKFNKKEEHNEETLALLAFVKINAGEAYGVEVTSKARAHLMERDEPIYKVEGILSREETYHTRILAGATQHFEGLQLNGAWKPPFPLKVLIYCLAKFPPSLFHPILLGSEICGVFSFNWLLQRLNTLFPNDPAIRESMERRLIEILIDEVGHIAYNRIAIGPRGLPYAKPIAGQVLKGVNAQTAEYAALGLDNNELSKLDKFDFHSLPQEVRDRAWFV